MISHCVSAVAGMIVGGLAVYLSKFEVSDPSVYAELDATRVSLNSANSELARLRPYARRLYRPDGSFEVSPDWAEWEAEEVGRARRLAELTAERDQLRVQLAEATSGAVRPDAVAGKAEEGRPS